MGVVHRPATAYGQELRKWEQHHTQYSIDADGNSDPGNPYRFRQYPRMLYRARQWKNGQMLLFAPPPSRYDYPTDQHWDLALQEVEVFNTSCQRTVMNESEELIAKGQGWCTSQQDALEQAKAEAWDIAQHAAEAAYQAERMSEKARLEFNQAQDDAGIDHVPDPAPPKRGPGRPKVIKVEPLNADTLVGAKE